MKIDGIRTWVNKSGKTEFEVISLYEKDGVQGIWAITGRWYGLTEPELGSSVRYVQGKYGFIAFPG